MKLKLSSKRRRSRRSNMDKRTHSFISTLYYHRKFLPNSKASPGSPESEDGSLRVDQASTLNLHHNPSLRQQHRKHRVNKSVQPHPPPLPSVPPPVLSTLTSSRTHPFSPSHLAELIQLPPFRVSLSRSVHHSRYLRRSLPPWTRSRLELLEEQRDQDAVQTSRGTSASVWSNQTLRQAVVATSCLMCSGSQRCSSLSRGPHSRSLSCSETSVVQDAELTRVTCASRRACCRTLPATTATSLGLLSIKS